MSNVDLALSVVLGVALAAAAGFRIFVPMLAPAALVAGTVLSAAVMTDLPPVVKWTAAIVAGGGAAGITHGLTAMVRANSTVFTGGLGNPVVATAEWLGALLVTLLALAAPVTALAVVLLLLWAAFRMLRRARQGMQQGAQQPAGTSPKSGGGR
jgi:UPF0716 family protein affecting phage T7 exclusion